MESQSAAKYIIDAVQHLTCGQHAVPTIYSIGFISLIDSARHLLVYQLELLLNLFASIIPLYGRTHLEGAWVWV